MVALDRSASYAKILIIQCHVLVNLCHHEIVSHSNLYAVSSDLTSVVPSIFAAAVCLPIAKSSYFTPIHTTILAIPLKASWQQTQPPLSMMNDSS